MNDHIETLFQSVNLEAENQMLGTLLNYCDQPLDITLPSDYFAGRRHKDIYEAVQKANDKGERGLPFIINELRNAKKWSDEMDMTARHPNLPYLLWLQECSGPLSQVNALTGLLCSAYRQRIIADSSTLHSEINNRFLTTEELEEAEEKLRTLAYQTSNGFHADLVEKIYDSNEPFLEEALAQKHEDVPIPTSITPILDEKLAGGFRPGEFIVLAGRPGLGKTSFMISVIHKIVNRFPVAFFSLEMTGMALIQRLLAMETRINLLDIIRRRFYGDPVKMQRVLEASSKIAKWPLFINDKPNVSVSGIESYVRKITSRDKPAPKMIVVDYLQLMRPENVKDVREQQISLISRSLKGLAKDLGVPIVGISQLNRSVFQDSKSKKPELHHLRESGALEQDADVVLAIHNRDPQSPDAVVCILKNRSGPTGEIPLFWTAELTQFEAR